jgi:hypothetical protein
MKQHWFCCTAELSQEENPVPDSRPFSTTGATRLLASTFGVWLDYLSTALAVVAVVTSTASFFFWQVFHRDVPMGIGNMRGTALATLVIAVPLLIVSMALASRRSLRARFVWLGALAYIAYNAVLFCFAPHFNSFFLLFAGLLALSFWALLTLLRGVDLAALQEACSRVPARSIAVYMLVTLTLFSGTWLRDIIPATLDNTMPASFEAPFRHSHVAPLDNAGLRIIR